MTTPAECPDACTEQHTYGPDCAATRDDYDPNAGMRERYAEALYAHHYGCPPSGDTWRGTRDDYLHTADIILAARDVYLNNVRRISKQQTTQLGELYMATKKRADQAEALADDLRERLRATSEACFTATSAAQDAESAIARVRDVIHDMEHTTGARTWAGWLATALELPKETPVAEQPAERCGNSAPQAGASQRMALRIQTCLDEQRDRARKDAAASRESERILQQQIDDQAKEIDRLRDRLAALHQGEEEQTAVRLSGPTPGEWLWHWNRETPARRLEVIAEMLDAGRRAGWCFVGDHEGVIERLLAHRDAAARVRDFLDRDQPGLCCSHLVGEIRAVLDPPNETPDA